MNIFEAAGIIFDVTPQTDDRLVLSIVDVEGGDVAPIIERYMTPDQLRVIGRELIAIAESLSRKETKQPKTWYWFSYRGNGEIMAIGCHACNMSIFSNATAFRTIHRRILENRPDVILDFPHKDNCPALIAALGGKSE